MKNLRVLLTAAGSPSAPGLIKCLKNNGEREIYVVGTDMKTDPTILQMVDKCRLVPASNAPEYIDVLLNISPAVALLSPTSSDLLCHTTLGWPVSLRV